MEFDHRFYEKTKKQQKAFQTKLAVLTFGILLLLVVLGFLTGYYVVALAVIPLVISVVAPFYDVPSLYKKGKLYYHSSLFLSETPKNEIFKIHGGTLFDYWFVINRKSSGHERRKFIIYQYLSGLLNLIEKYGNEDKDDFKVKGTSYILNKRTAERLGFHVQKPDVVDSLILFFNYFNILVTSTIGNAKLNFPRLNNIYTFETSIRELNEKRQVIERLKNNLNGQ